MSSSVRQVREHPAFPWVAPFALFMLLLVVGPRLPLGLWEQPLRVILLTVALIAFSRGVIDLRLARPAASVMVGIAVFIVWVMPDLLWPGYRGHWLFTNPIVAEHAGSLPDGFTSSPAAIAFRAFRAVVLVPVIEELFWRGWLMRWIIRSDFQNVPLGAYSPRAFWITAALFASEHGSFWGVGLLAGIAYNWWILRTRRLADCILAHAVTNGLLSAYVVAAGRWEYWL